MKKVMPGARATVIAASTPIGGDAQPSVNPGSGLRKARASGGVVVVVSSDPAQIERLRSAISDSGAGSLELQDSLALRRMIASPDCAVAVVDLPGNTSESAAALEATRNFRENG